MFYKLSTTTLCVSKLSTNVYLYTNLTYLPYCNGVSINLILTQLHIVLPTTINLLDVFHSKQFMPYNPPMYLPSPIVNPAGGAAT